MTLPDGPNKEEEGEPPVAATAGPVTEAFPRGGDPVAGAPSSLRPEAPPDPAVLLALWIETGVVFLVASVPHVFYSIWSHWLPDPQALPFAYLESAYLVESVALGALGLHVIWRSGEPLEEFGIVRPSWWDIPGGLFVMAVVWATDGQVLDPFLVRFLPDDASTYEERMSLLFPRPQSTAQYALLAISCAAVGLQEEIIYRGYLLPRLGRLTGSDGAGLLIGTLIFALVHIYQGPCGAISAAWFGLIVGALFLVTRRIWPLALAHGLGNFVAIGW